MQWRAIISFHFTRTCVHELTQLEPLLEPLWDLGNVYANSGYRSVKNCRLIVGKGERRLSDRNETRQGWVPGGKIMHGNPYYDTMERYKKDPESWMKQYHQRSVIEAVFSGLKRRLGGSVASIKRNIQHVEIALKIIVYNLMILARKIVEEEYF